MANDNDIQKVIADTRRWIEQEKAWGGDLYATRDGGDPKTAAIRPQPQKEDLSIESSRRISGVAAGSGRPALSSSSSPKARALQALHEKYRSCVRCPLGEHRLNFVFGAGSADAQVMLIGEGPGYDEDHKGEPFIGRSGQLLGKMLEAIGLSRQTVFIANVVKCHPMINPMAPEDRGNDRPPTPNEVAACSPILQQQIAVIQPKVLFTLGSPSTKAILGTQEGISKVRGKLYPMPMTYFNTIVRDDFPGLTEEQLEPLKKIQVLPTYHPAALLRNPNLKKDAWEDLKLLKKTIFQPA